MIKKKMNIYNDESETAMAFSLFFISIRQVQDGKRNRKDISRKKKINMNKCGKSSVKENVHLR